MLLVHVCKGNQSISYKTSFEHKISSEKEKKIHRTKYIEHSIINIIAINNKNINNVIINSNTGIITTTTNNNT